MPDRARPALAWLTAGVCLIAGCAASPGRTDAATPPGPRALAGPTGTEARYVSQTARTLFRGRAVERSENFVSGPAGPYGICVRAPSAGGHEHVLLVLQRRILDDFISQAADDVLVLRGADDTAPCRRIAAGWVRAG